MTTFEELLDMQHTQKNQEGPLTEPVTSVVPQIEELPDPGRPQRGTSGVTQLGVQSLLENQPQLRSDMTPGQKMASRIIVETGGGIAAGPFGAAKNLTTATRLINAARVGAGETVGSLISESFDPSKDPFVTGGITGAVGAGFELATPQIARGIEAARRGGLALKEGASPIIRKILAKGKPVAPGFYSDNFLIQVLDNITASSFFGGGKLRKAREAGAEVAQDEVRAFLDSLQHFTKGGVEVEDLIRDILADGADAFRVTAAKKYGLLDELVGNSLRVDLNPLISELLSSVKKFGGADGLRVLQEIDRLRKLGEVGANNSVSFETAATIRSGLLQLARSSESLISSGSSTLGRQMAPLVDAAMNRAIQRGGKNLPPGVKPKDVQAAWRGAQGFWKHGIKEFNNNLIKALSTEDPRKLASALMNNPRAAKRVKNLIVNSKDFTEEAVFGTIGSGVKVEGKLVWEEVQGHLLNKLAETTIDSLGEISGKKLARRMITQKEVLLEVLGPKRYENAVRLFNELALAEGSRAAKDIPGGIWMQFEQATAAASAVAFMFGQKGLGTTGLFVLAAPRPLTKLLLNDKFTNWALLGLNPKTPPEQFVRAIGQMAVIAMREGAKVEFNPMDGTSEFSPTMQRRAFPGESEAVNRIRTESRKERRPFPGQVSIE